MRILSLAALTAIGLIAATPLMAQTPQTKAPETKMAPAKPADTKMAPAKSTDSKAATTGAATSEPLDINTATAAQLEALPDVGKTRAEAIIKGRPYKAKDELVDKKILPRNVYDHVKNRIIAKQS